MMKETETLPCDVLVIGSGPGGSITACLLAEAGKDVLLLEEGPLLDVDFPPSFSPEEMRQKYRNGGMTIALGKTRVAYVEGRCVGGGSEINAGLYHRLPDDIQTQWQKSHRIADFDANSLAPHFESCEKDLSISDLPTEGSPASKKLKEGADKLQWKVVKVPRWFASRQDGNGRWHHSRKSMTQTYIPRALDTGCRLLPNTRVNGIYCSAGKARYAVAESARDGKTVPVRILFQSVFVCCGAVQTPALLRRSGIKRHIGDSLRMHPTVKFVARFEEPVYDASLPIPVHQVKEFSPHLSFGGSIGTPPYLAVGLLNHKEELKELGNWQKMSVYYAMTEGTGAGTVRNVPFCEAPLVRYRITNQDLNLLADGLQKLGRLLFEAGAVELCPSVRGYPAIKNRKDLDIFGRSLPEARTDIMTVHLFASCPMGENREQCAVNSFGKVHGYRNAYVNDASILPGPPGVNPQGTIMALARRNTLHFLEE